LSITKSKKKEPKLNLKISKSICGTISLKNKKLNCPSWSLNPSKCKTGKILSENKKSICSKCYANRMQSFRSNIAKSWDYNYHNYINMTNNRKEWIEAMIYQINYACKKMNTNYFRWFVGGDLQSQEMLESIITIARKMPEIQFWMPTKEYSILRANKKRISKNLLIRVSNPMINPRYTHSKHKNTSTSYTKKAPIKLGTVCKELCEPCNYACWKKSVKNITYLMH
jgi:hypothetical protein